MLRLKFFSENSLLVAFAFVLVFVFVFGFFFLFLFFFVYVARFVFVDIVGHFFVEFFVLHAFQGEFPIVVGRFFGSFESFVHVGFFRFFEFGKTRQAIALGAGFANFFALVKVILMAFRAKSEFFVFEIDIVEFGRWALSA